MKFVKKIPLILALLAGFAGAYMRGHELAFCYDFSTCLYTWDNFSWMLIGLGGAITVLFLIWALLQKKCNKKFMEMYGVGIGGTLANVLSGMLLAAIGVLIALSCMYTRSYMDLTFGALSVFAGIAFIVQAGSRKRQSDNPEGFWYAVPIFWACFFMVRTFMEHPVEPVLQLFACDLLAVGALLLSVYSCAAGMFAERREKTALFATLMAIALIIASIGGNAVACYFENTNYFLVDAIDRNLINAAMLPMLITNASVLLSRLEFVSREKSEDEI